MYVKFTTILFILNTIRLINTKSTFDITNIDYAGRYEAFLLLKLEQYMKHQQLSLDILKIKIKDYKNQNIIAHEKKYKYYSNPIYALRMTRQFSIDWFELEKFIANEDTVISIHYLRNTLNFPSRVDFEDAVSAFLSLQHFYNLEISSIAKGELNGIQYNTSLVLDDCLGLGFVSFGRKQYCDAVKWTKEGLQLVELAEVNDSTKQIKIFLLKILFTSYFELGDMKTALITKQNLITLSPNQINEADREKVQGIIELDPKFNQLAENQYFNEVCQKPESSTEYKYEEYNQLCRGIFKRSSVVLKKLYCRLINNNNPFLIIGPIKQEILNFEPLICLYHDVLFDKEIEIIKKMSKINFIFYNEYDPGIAKRRTGKKIIINSTKLDYLKQRAKIMTGLNMHPNDKLALQKFEISTKSSPHFDALKDEIRLADQVKYSTLIYFMSNVEQGGQTVFPDLGLAVSPKKGTALFWYNTFASGYLNFKSIHAGCPVLVGSKWMATLHLQEIAD